MSHAALRLARLLDHAVDGNATEVHLHVGHPPQALVDGSLQNLEDEVLDEQGCKDLLLATLPRDSTASRSVPMLNYVYPWRDVNFRVSVRFEAGHLHATLRKEC
ncbi:MAG: hypothetical protein ACYCW6_00455 [Candidatus Xenobia bacterium]